MSARETAPGPGSAALAQTDDAASRAVVPRLGLFLLAVTFLNALDRTNVSFAALQMNRDLGFDSRDYGLGVGLFFLGFVLFVFPCTLLARQIGAVRTLALMMIAWGSVSALMGAVQGKASFYTLRILLGMAEAAVTPLLLVYAGQWAPQRAMARAFSYLGLAFPLAFVINAPLSGWIITTWHDVGGLAGWRWMFIVQGLPTRPPTSCQAVMIQPESGALRMKASGKARPR